MINAYKTAAADVLANNQVIEKLILTELVIEFEYPQMNLVMRIIKDFDLAIIDQKLEMSCKMTLGVRLSLEDNAIRGLSENHTIRIIKTEQ